MNRLDDFLSNMFDRQDIDSMSHVDPVSGTICHSKLMQNNHLIANALFRFVWKQISGGSLPSARCYAEFYHACGAQINVDIPTIIGWIITDCRGPFFLLKDTVIIKERLLAIQQGSCERYLSKLRSEISSQLHRSLVEKFLDRFVSGGALITRDVVEEAMKTSLWMLYNGFGKIKQAGNDERYVNRVSKMVASVNEETNDDGRARLCGSPLRISVNDAIKRRHACDLHFLKRSFGKAMVVSHASIIHHAEVVRGIVGSSWVISEETSRSLRRHLPRFSSAYISLHKFGSTLDEAFQTIQPPGGAEAPRALLIVFDAPLELDDSVLLLLGKEKGFHRVFRAYIDGQVRSTHHSSIDSQSVVFPLFFGNDKTCDWTFPLLVSSLQLHMRMACPLTSQNPFHASLLVERCVTNIALSRGLLDTSTVFHVKPRQEHPPYTIMAVDTRQDPATTVLSVLVSLSSLASVTGWGVHIMCAKRNRREFESMLSPHCPNASYDDTFLELNVPRDAFDVETGYNQLMKNPKLWASLLPSRMVLTVQDDGILIRRGLETLDDGNILDGGIPYLGSPWADISANAGIKNDVPSLVGNGGLSLRVVADMVQITSDLSDTDRHRLFQSRIEPIPEDVMFAMSTSIKQHNIPSYKARVQHVASRFACEQVPCDEALGFHKQWPYWSVAQTHHHMEKIQRDEIINPLPCSSDKPRLLGPS